jgi:hypothetical protein
MKEETLFPRHVKGIDIFCHNLLVQMYYPFAVSIAAKIKYTVTIITSAIKHMKTTNAVIPRLDRGIQISRMFLDWPVKPDNDDF